MVHGQAGHRLEGDLVPAEPSGVLAGVDGAVRVPRGALTGGPAAAGGLESRPGIESS